MMKINLMLDILCWTPLSKPIRMMRMKKIAKNTTEDYDLRRIDSLINSIVSEHSDLLS